jgi:hypothetical protein
VLIGLERNEKYIYMHINKLSKLMFDFLVVAFISKEETMV